MDINEFFAGVPIQHVPRLDIGQRAPGCRFYIGLDLGQARDFTAVAVIEYHIDSRQLHCRHLERYPLGTTYPQIVDRVRDLVRALPAGSHLVVDATGVGRPVCDMLDEAGLPHQAVTITGGNTETATGVPKRDLVSVLLATMQGGRLKFAADMPYLKALVDELLNFRVKLTAAANDTYEAWRESDHDDLTLALALATYMADRHGIGFHVY
jgi:phage FluMu gp28-like protein